MVVRELCVAHCVLVRRVACCVHAMSRYVRIVSGGECLGIGTRPYPRGIYGVAGEGSSDRRIPVPGLGNVALVIVSERPLHCK